MKHPTRTLIERKSRTGTFKGILDEQGKKASPSKELHDLCILYMLRLLQPWHKTWHLSELAETVLDVRVEDAEIRQYGELVRASMFTLHCYP
jgi:hypothetical protein